MENERVKLLLGTSNPGKIIEVRAALQALPVEILAPADIGLTERPYETGNTFEENARGKARYYFEASRGIATLADDSGIIVEALQSELGIHTRRWGAGSDASDQHWISFFLDRMKREENKAAHFVCVLCFIDSDGNEHLCQGSCDGSITESLEATFLPGLPISACFKPDGYDKVYAALSMEEKNRISHRGRALEKWKEYLSHSAHS